MLGASQLFKLLREAILRQKRGTRVQLKIHADEQPKPLTHWLCAEQGRQSTWFLVIGAIRTGGRRVVQAAGRTPLSTVPKICT